LLERKAVALSSRLRDLFPALSFEIAFAWAGTFGSTSDGLPLIGRSHHHPGLWYSLGYGGNGITFSVTAARLLTDAYLGRPSPDAQIFALDRHSSRAAH
jgi:glycine/D-amino acid oxidase-like deaminating enzyme